jgi:anti-sigma-K factor RskA
MNHDEWLERAEIYAVGALDGDELAQFEAHLASGCPACESRLRDTREALTLLPRSLTPITPPLGIKARLLEQIAAESTWPPPLLPRLRQRWWGVGVSALAAAGLLIVLGIDFYRTRQELHRMTSMVSTLQADLARREETIQSLRANLESIRRDLQRAQGEVATLQAELAKREETIEAERQELRRVQGTMTALQSELAEREMALHLLSTPQVRLVRLTGLEPSPGAAGRLLWNPAAYTGLLLTSGLPQTSRDRIYELWAIAGNEPIPAGIFAVDERGHAVLHLPPLPKTKRVNKFAVTLEPAGGVAQPSGAMLLLGSL